MTTKQLLTTLAANLDECLSQWDVSTSPKTIVKCFAQAIRDTAASIPDEPTVQNDWKLTLHEALVVAGIFRKEHESNPALALNDLIKWETSVALDPSVSEDARKLQDGAVPNEVVEQMAEALRLVKSKWTFNNAQQHTHTWHDWADCIAQIEQSLAALESAKGAR